MIITRNFAPPTLPARLKAPQQPPVPGPPPEPSSPRGEVFVQSGASCAHTLAKIGGLTNGGSLGYLGGAMVAGSLGTSGPVALALGLTGAAVGGTVGWKAMGRVSDWAAHLAQKVAPGHALGAELAGRTALNLAVDLLAGSPVTAALDLSMTAGWGLYRASKHH